jgi:WD40 repeat protein
MSPILSLWFGLSVFASTTDGAGSRAAQIGSSQFRHWDLITAFAISFDDRWIVSSSADRVIKVWSLRHGTEQAAIDNEQANGLALDGKNRVYYWNEKGIWMWDWQEKRKPALFRKSVLGNAPKTPGPDGLVGLLLQDSISCVAFAPKGGLFACTSMKGQCFIFDQEKHAPICAVEESTPFPAKSLCAFSNDGKLLAYTRHDHSVVVVNVVQKKECARLLGHTSTVRSLSFSSDSKQLAGSSKGLAIIWDVSGFREVYRLTSDALALATFGSADRTLFVSETSGDLSILDCLSKTVIRKLEGPSGGLGAILTTK